MVRKVYRNATILFAPLEGGSVAIAPQQCHQTLQNQGCSCQLEHRPFLLLAVVLAELALMCPISIIPQGQATLFKVHTERDVSESSANHFTQKEFLSTVQKTASRNFRKAVEYCLDEDKKTDAGSNIPVTREYDHASYYKEVIECLNQDYQRLQRHAQYHHETYSGFRNRTRRHIIARTQKGD